MKRWMFVVVGCGFVLDSYDLFLINIVIVILSNLYEATDLEIACLAASTLVGATLGQFFCGLISKKIGKGASFVLSIALVIFSMIAIVSSFHNRYISVYWILTIWRFILGLGIGMEYPLSASIISDFLKPDNPRPGRSVVGVFSMQGVGNTIAPLVCLALLYIQQLTLDAVWRIAFVVALLPSFFLVRMRWKLHKVVTENDSRNAVLADRVACALPPAVAEPEERDVAENQTLVNRERAFESRRILNLMGCALAWFFFDIAFYGTALFSSVILKDVFDVNESTPSRSDLQAIALGTFLISTIGLPGYWASVWLVDRMGYVLVQIMGFTLTTLIYLAMGFFYSAVSSNMSLFISLYGLSFFFSNFGPNATTYLIPTQVFSAQHRTAYHGYAAAAGKVGAIVGSFSFKILLDAIGVEVTLYICGLVSFAGLVSTIVFIRRPEYSSIKAHMETQSLLSTNSQRSETEAPTTE
eukprot:ANDGO_02579.mRNA.1 putative inorganic phosphate transporter 1-6